MQLLLHHAAAWWLPPSRAGQWESPAATGWLSPGRHPATAQCCTHKGEPPHQHQPIAHSLITQPSPIIRFFFAAGCACSSSSSHHQRLPPLRAKAKKQKQKKGSSTTDDDEADTSSSFSSSDTDDVDLDMVALQAESDSVGGRSLQLWSLGMGGGTAVGSLM